MISRVLSGLIAIVFLAVGSVAMAGEPISIAFKPGKEPYVLPKSPFTDADYIPTNALGIEPEICYQAFKAVGKEIKPVYMNYNRMPTELVAKNIDAATQLVPDLEDVTYVGGYVHLHDHVIYSLSNDQEIKTIADVAGLRVLAFQQASKFLGPEYNAAIATAKSYREIDDQEKQVQIFLAGRTDVVVLDIGIFKHWSKVYGEPDKEYGYASILGDRFFFSVGFTDPDLAAEFEKGLNIIKENGTYDKIYAKYLD
jgi:polar amino acid transport system substrate-binding protein